MAVEDLVHELCESFIDARSKSPAAFRNMREAQGPAPSTTPGNGSPGGGSAGHGESVVERMIDDDGNMRIDAVAADLEEATDLLHRMKPLVRDFRDLMQRWGYTTSGEYLAGKRRQPAQPTEGDTNRDRWCSHHEKFGIAEPRGRNGRNGLCGWCYGFERAEGVLPPGSFLEHRARGGTVTKAMVDHWNKERATAAKVQRQRVRRKANKRKRR